jgi:hypothetical protein
MAGADISTEVLALWPLDGPRVQYFLLESESQIGRVAGAKPSTGLALLSDAHS